MRVLSEPLPPYRWRDRTHSRQRTEPSVGPESASWSPVERQFLSRSQPASIGVDLHQRMRPHLLAAATTTMPLSGQPAAAICRTRCAEGTTRPYWAGAATSIPLNPAGRRGLASAKNGLRPRMPDPRKDLTPQDN